MEEVILSQLGKDQLPQDMDYALTAHVHGQVNCVAKWIQEGMTVSPEVMASYNIENMPSLIKQYFIE